MTDKLTVAICGAGGRMGQAIIQALVNEPDLTLTGALEGKGHPLLGRDAGEVAKVGPLGVNIISDPTEATSHAHVVIDFSTPLGLLAMARGLSPHVKGLVTGVTGLCPEDLEELVHRARTIPVVAAPNMSIGINLLYDLADRAVRFLGPDYDVEIIEVHHRAKVDSPSGTALKLAGVVAKARELNYDLAVRHGRAGAVGPRSQGEIGIHAVRGGDTVGDHTLLISGPGERLELTHRASSRTSLVRGTLRAARWVVDQPPGMYSMGQVLGC